MKFRTETCLTAVRRGLGSNRLHIRRTDYGLDLYERRPSPDPATPAQCQTRESVNGCAAVWRQMPEEEKELWRKAARNDTTWIAESHGYLTGYSLFLHSAMNRLQMGLQPTTIPPGDGRPDPLRSAVLLPADDPRTFAFVLYHGIRPKSCGDYRVRALLTPSTTGHGRAPDRHASRLICGSCSGSTQPLVKSGGVLTFPAAQIAVPPGSRFGVWMRIIRVSDGLASGELFLDVIRTGSLRDIQEPETQLDTKGTL